MLAGRKERREVPHEAEAWIEFRTLSGAELDEAEQIQTQRTMQLVKGFDANTLRAWAAEQSGAQGAARSEQRFDRDTLIGHGIVAWSLSEPCDAEHKRLLDAQTREWAVDVILEMNVRPLGSGNGSEDSSAAENSHRSAGALTGSSAPE